MRLTFTYLVFFLFSNLAFSQIGIGTNVPSSSSELDISSSNMGLLIPRMTTIQRNAIVSPSASMTVYDTDVDLYYYFSTSNNSWTPINVCSIKTVSSGGFYTLNENDNGRIIDFTGTSNLIIRVPNTLPIGFQVSLTQANTGIISFIGTGGMIVNNRYGAGKSSGKWAKLGLEIKSSTICVLSGDVK
jgi:hypothetical protein